MTDDLCHLPASTLRAHIAARKVSPVELMTAVLARAERLQPELNCFITLIGEQAMEAARESERVLMRGEAQGPLHGIPFAAK
ncbi:MAG: amidase family protein, partial [Alphaproteobacteria bacterium]|nr:amidase family protein [Alphaproteobacteria bacterium]